MDSFANNRITLHGGDCLQVLPTLVPDSHHGCITDPPYHFGSIIKRWSNSASDAVRADHRVTGAYGRHSRGFMGQTWDGGDVAFQPNTWELVARALKPGAHLVAFGAPKNVHRLTCAIEDAGFEIRDQLLWVFGVGFPKSHDAKKAMGKARDVDLFREALEHASGKWEGWGTALKPAYEPIILARKPMAGSVQQNFREHGCGGINIDACRIHGPDVAYDRDDEATQDKRYTDDGGTNFAAKPGRRYRVQRLNPGAQVNASGQWKQDAIYEGELKPGRWPANFLHDGSDDVVDAFPESAGALSDVAAGITREPKTCYGQMPPTFARPARNDAGSAARFFYCAKATAAERIGWCTVCGERFTLNHRDAHRHGSANFAHVKSHATVKPLSLMRWLCRLIVPVGGLLLDPFAGTGSTAQAAFAEGQRCTLIEQAEQYQADIRFRLGAATAEAAE